MSFVLRWFARVLRKPPVAIFLILLLGSCLASYGFIYSIAASHQSTINPNFFHFKTDYAEVEFPKNWIAFEGKVQNATGLFYSIVSFNPFTGTLFQFQFYDENATRFLLGELDLTNTSAVLQEIINDTYANVLKENSNVTLIYNENGTMPLPNSSLEAKYSAITLKNLPVETGDLYNVTSLIAICIDEQKLIYILFTSEESNWPKEYELFTIIINSIKLG